MRNEKVRRRGYGFIAQNAVEMTDLGADAIAERRVQLDVSLGQGNIVKTQVLLTD